MKKITLILSIVLTMAIAGYVSSCTSLRVAAKSGAQIWGETCIRCHNPASPDTFSDVEWDVAAMHMQIRANLTPDEVKKVVEFFQSAN